MENIKDIVLDLIVDICATKKVLKDSDMDLIKCGYIDSMGVVELLTGIEDEFDVEIPLESFNPDDFNTVNKIVKFVEKNIANDGN